MVVSGDERADRKREVKKAYQNLSDIFVGEVIEINKEFEDYIKVKFKIEESWKGKSEKEVILKVSQDQNGCAYFPFNFGETYLIYTWVYKGETYLPNCSRTSPSKLNKDIALLNKIKKKKAKSSPK